MAKKKSTVQKVIKKLTKKPVKKVAKKTTKAAVKKSTKKAVKRNAKAGKSAAEQSSISYINYIPKKIPLDKILCHGGVIPQTPDQKPGMNGFRPWLDDDDQAEKYGPCNCGWSGSPHYMPLTWLESDRKKHDARKFPRK